MCVQFLLVRKIFYMRVLFVGDVFGRPGRSALEKHLQTIKKKYLVDFCIVNGENAAHGKGITQECAKQLYHSGADVITLGNHAWDNKDVFNIIDRDERLVRAYNFPPSVPGRGYVTVVTPAGYKLTVAQLCMRLFMMPVNCPFYGADALLKEIGQGHPIIIDMHGEATSEKVALGWYLDGRVSAVIGTHTHVPTADERILPKGTAYISDVGMTGAYDSVIGMDVDMSVSRFLTSMRVPYRIATDNVKISAALISIDEDTGLSQSIQRIFFDVMDEYGEQR